MGEHRSALPRVIGVIAIVFACIGLGMSWLFGRRPLIDLPLLDDPDRFESALLWAKVWLGVSALVFVLHLLGGILACMYKKLGLRLLTAYGIVAVILVVVDFVLLSYLPTSPRDRHGYGLLLRGMFDLVALPWPIVVLVLANLRRSRMSCR